MHSYTQKILFTHSFRLRIKLLFDAPHRVTGYCGEDSKDWAKATLKTISFFSFSRRLRPDHRYKQRQAPPHFLQSMPAQKRSQESTSPPPHPPHQLAVEEEEEEKDDDSHQLNQNQNGEQADDQDGTFAREFSYKASNYRFTWVIHNFLLTFFRRRNFACNLHFTRNFVFSKLISFNSQIQMEVLPPVAKTKRMIKTMRNRSTLLFSIFFFLFVLLNAQIYLLACGHIHRCMSTCILRSDRLWDHKFWCL